MAMLPLVSRHGTGQAGTMSERNAQVYVQEEGTGREAPEAVRDKKEMIRRATPVAWAALLIVWVVWGSTYLAIRIGDETIPPLVLASVRFFIAGLIMFPPALRQARSQAR